jgi:hypothetical protein
MTTATERAAEIVTVLIAAGARATIDPQAAPANLPGILVPPPGRTYDVSCGFTARWELAALAPAPTGANHTAWQALDELATLAADVLPVETAQLVTLNLAGTDYPAYLLAWNEALA